MAWWNFWNDLWPTVEVSPDDPQYDFLAATSNQGQQDSYGIDAFERIMEANREAQMLAAQQQQEFELSAAREANSFSAGQAQLNRDWQTSANKLAMDFEHNEAEIQRNWINQQRSTAYQTAVADLKEAGLNPVLAASGSGAAVTSGSMASGVSSAGSAAQGLKANGQKANVDVTTYTQLFNTLIQGAFQLGSSIIDKIPLGKSTRKIGF